MAGLEAGDLLRGALGDHGQLAPLEAGAQVLSHADVVADVATHLEQLRQVSHEQPVALLAQLGADAVEVLLPATLHGHRAHQPCRRGAPDLGSS